MSERRDSPYVREVGRELSNWGKWGADDERGTLNYITQACVIAAANLVKTGKIISLSINLDDKGPQDGASARFNPIHLMSSVGSDAISGAQKLKGGWNYTDDVIIMPTQSATHWDSLGHISYDGRMYNDYSVGEISSRGAKRNSIEKIRDGVVGRGVLLDIARLNGREMLDHGYAITPAELDACAKTEKIDIRSGDVLCIRTGTMRKLKSGDKVGYRVTKPGLAFDCVYWLHEHRVAAVASDTEGVEVTPSGFDCPIPLHMVALRDMGLTLGELFDLEMLADECAQNGVYEFLFAGPPLPITGAVGSPVNPLAIL